MISQIFKFGGGAGIGSYVIVMREGSLIKPDAEKIRWSYDNGDNLYLSILDDVTEEALLPLTGYVDNNNILHLSGRDFDDNKTYEFSISGEDHEIDSDIIDGITLGNGTIPTEGGGGSGLSVYEFDLYIDDPSQPFDILTPEQMEDIWENEYDIIKVNAHMNIEGGLLVKQFFERVQVVEGMAITYATCADPEQKITQISIMNSGGTLSYELTEISLSGGSGSSVSGTNDGTNWTSLTIDGSTYGIPQGGAEIQHATNADIDALFNPPMATITFNLTSCHAEINGETISSGYQVPIGQPLEIAIDGDYLEYDWYCSVLTMNGVDIRNLFDNLGNPTIIEISSVTGDIYMEIECMDAGQEPEDIPVESIEFTNLPEDHSIELEVGDVIDMSQYIEVSPSDATDSSYTLSTDAPSVLSINGTTITVLQGAEGLNANLTVTANDGSGCSDIMIVDILNGEEPDPEMATISISNLTDCHLEIDGEEIYDGHEVELGTAVDIDVVPNDTSIIEADYSYQTLTMNGQNIGSYFNTTDGIISIPNVTGNIVIDGIVCTEREPEPEDVPIQSLRYTDGSGNTCVGFGMLEGESVDLWANLEVLPEDATSGVEFISDDDGIVQVDGTGIATATGVAGESTTITMSSMENPNIYTTVEISINIDDEDDEEE